MTLLHVFDVEISLEQMKAYVDNMYGLVEKVRPPIQYSYYYVDARGRFDVRYVYDYRSLASTNPFAVSEESRKIISVIRSLLRIPSPP